jgi:hypothetical protein
MASELMRSAMASSSSPISLFSYFPGTDSCLRTIARSAPSCRLQAELDQLPDLLGYGRSGFNGTRADLIERLVIERHDDARRGAAPRAMRRA